MTAGPLAGYRAAVWRGDLRYLLAGRGLRSLTQGYLAVVVPLFLTELGFSTVQVGALLATAAGASALLTAAVGFVADRHGRKAVLVGLALATTAGGVVFALSRSYVLLLVAAAFGTIGRGGGAASGGAFGPYYPAEQALIAELSPDRERTTVFSALSLVGVLAAALGAPLAGLPRLVAAAGWGTRHAGYAAVFWLTALLGLLMALVVLPVHEASAARAGRAAPPRLSPRTRRLLWRLALTNGTNGLAVGFLGPILVLWFHLRYGVGPAAVGALFFVVNLAAALPYLGAPWVVRRLGGAVRTVVRLRLAAAALLAVVPLLPTFALAGAVYLVRMLVNAVTVPVRQSYVMGIVPPSERSRVAGLSNLPSRVLAMPGPAVAGALFQEFWLGLPLELAAVLQLLHAALYWGFFRDVPPPEETRGPS
jgi:MFS family permease